MNDQRLTGAVVLVVIILFLVWVVLRGMRAKRRLAGDALDAVLFMWTAGDPFTVRDLLNGGVSIIGRAGSGKTSSSGKCLGKAIVRYKKNRGSLSGGIILCAKPEDAAMWKEIFGKAGRKDDLIVFSPDMPHRFNFLDYVIQSGGHTRDVTKCITTIGETLRSSDTKGGENADFWEREQERFIYNAVAILKIANGKVSAPEIQRFISGAALNAATIGTPDWQEGFHNQTLKKAFEAKKSPIDEADCGLAIDFWLGEYPNAADKTRSSILTGVMGILHTFNTGMVRELVSGETNCSPDDMLAGKWILVNMSPAEWGDQGAFVCGGWKFLTQKRIIRREAKAGDCINVIWCDEAQQFVTSYDAHYLAQCRSHMGCMVYLTQSLHSYYSALHGQSGRHQADALLTNFHHKIFHALGDEISATYAANLLGKSLQTFVGTSLAPVEDLFEEMMGRQKITSNTSEHYEQILQTNVFMNGLRTGGTSNGFLCDAFVLRSGEPFSNGKNYLEVAFSQKG
jgi:hypothetical protein